ncbi:uncharacterized protein LOC121737160 [Aricia agestis]|uniref:uncharacterized protein LOC121737160 n=1 Tax=Aricia agestis TaxID=91739 RepID=UPI001C20313F|nr:uncharacterized protein LOC121737160 [Aricia agestis]
MPKVYQSSTRKMVLSIRRFCELEKAKNGPVIPLKQVTRRVATMTGVSEETVKEIIKEKVEGGASTSQNKKLKTQKKKTKQAKDASMVLNVGGVAYTSESNPPPKKKTKQANQIELNADGTPITKNKRTQKKKIKQEKDVPLNVFQVASTRSTIYEMYTVRKEVILNAIRNEIKFQGGHKDLYKIIKQIGFRFQECGDNRKILMENPDVIISRKKYLNFLKEKRKDNIPIIYIGETSVHASFTSEGWQIEDFENNTPNTTFCTWIVVHAGGEMGFVPNACSIFQCQKLVNHKNYMCSENFMDWLQRKLIPFLPPNTLVVMDNAPYRSEKINKQPSAKSTKAKMQNWLTRRGILYDPNMLRAELYELVRRSQEEPVYRVDKLLEAYGHSVARLPPNHGEFNAIEYVWKILKQGIAGSKVGQNVSNIATLLKHTLNAIAVSDWYDICQKVSQLEKKYLDTDGVLDEEIDNFLKEQDDSSSDSDSSSSSESSVLVLDDDYKSIPDVPNILSVELYY